MNTVNMNPGGYTTWPLLTGVTILIHATTAMSRYRLEEFPQDGQQLKIMCCAGGTGGSIALHTGAFNNTRKFHPQSTGYASTWQVGLSNVGAKTFNVVYIQSLDQWLLLES